MVRAQVSLADVKGALVEGAGVVEVALVAQDASEGGEVGRDLGMITKPNVSRLTLL